MVCPPWTGFDLVGRPVCADSFMNKTAGCNSARDRVDVENSLRPQYIEYVNLDAAGIKGATMYDSMGAYDEGIRRQSIYDTCKVTGNPGLGFGSHIRGRCSNYNYSDAMAQSAQLQRQIQAGQIGYKANDVRLAAGI